MNFVSGRGCAFPPFFLRFSFFFAKKTKARLYIYICVFPPGPKNGDALVKIAYADASTHWDCILVYTLGDTKNEQVRLSFLHALLMEGLVVEREVSGDGVHVFVKVLCGFERLCWEAERESVKFALQVRFLEAFEFF